MQSYISSLTSQTESLIRRLEASISRLKPDALSQKIADVVKLVFYAFITCTLYWINPSFLAVGFIVGIIYDEGVRETIQKIKIVWQAQPWSVCILGAVASFLSLHVTLAASATLWGASMGSKMVQEAYKIHRERLMDEGERRGMRLADGYH